MRKLQTSYEKFHFFWRWRQIKKKNNNILSFKNKAYNKAADQIENLSINIEITL